MDKKLDLLEIVLNPKAVSRPPHSTTQSDDGDSMGSATPLWETLSFSQIKFDIVRR